MKPRRRMTFQLTPLLDLLLIVLFAQYMEVQQKAESAQGDVDQQKAELVEAYDERREQLEAEYQQQASKLEADRQRYSNHYESIVRQHQQAGAALAESLNLPGRLMEEIVRLRTDGQPEDATRLQEAVERLKQQLSVRDAEMLQFILKYDEMQKHVSVWELYLQDNGHAAFSDGTQTDLVTFRTEDEFVSRAFEVSKSFTEPKPLVIILLTHGDTQAGLRRRAADGMPLLMDQLRRDAGNTRWFDFSLMGYRPNGPLFGKLPSGGENTDR